jgi:hypothetical protein
MCPRGHMYTYLMAENEDLRSRLAIGRKRDGRRQFDEGAIEELVALCLKPGVSVARVHGSVLGGRDLWREALQDYVAGIRGEFGMLHGEPWPPVDPGILAFFLNRRAA